MNLEDINKDYQKVFDCDTQVDWDCDELNISIGDKQSVCISNITKTDAITVAEELLSKWDFSYFLEFDGIEEYYKFFKN